MPAKPSWRIPRWAIGAIRAIRVMVSAASGQGSALVRHSHGEVWPESQCCEAEDRVVGQEGLKQFFKTTWSKLFWTLVRSIGCHFYACPASWRSPLRYPSGLLILLRLMFLSSTYYQHHNSHQQSEHLHQLARLCVKSLLLHGNPLMLTHFICGSTTSGRLINSERILQIQWSTIWYRFNDVESGHCECERRERLYSQTQLKWSMLDTLSLCDWGRDFQLHDWVVL